MIVAVIVYERTEEGSYRALVVKLDPEEEETVRDRWFVPAKFSSENRNPKEVAKETLVRYLEKEKTCEASEGSEIRITRELTKCSEDFYDELCKIEAKFAHDRDKIESEIRLFEAEVPKTILERLRKKTSLGLKFCAPSEMPYIREKIRNEITKDKILPLMKPIVKYILHEGTIANYVGHDAWKEIE